ncbi:MAG: polyhydroxyalkanoic acid system family protein [Bdellovibrionota bacterium]
MEIECPGQAKEIYAKLKSKISELQKQGKLGQVKEINFDDAAQEATAVGTGFKSKIQVKDGKVVVDLDLNFLLKAMRPQIEEGIRRSLSKALS